MSANTWGNRLRAKVHTEHGTKALRDCTTEDLLDALEQRQKIRREAGRFDTRMTRKLINAMTEKGVTTVGKLTEDPR